MRELTTFQNFKWTGSGCAYVYLAAAGFEQRARRAVELLSQQQVPLAGAIVLDLRKQRIPENDLTLDYILEVLKKQVSEKAITVMQAETVEQVSAWVEKLPVAKQVRLIVDVTAMPHSLILRALRSAARTRCVPLVLYTEAEEYYPRFEDAQKYLVHDDDELAFDEAARQEKQEIMYAGLASIGTVKGFEGRLIPTAPTSVILFPTFKRLRISAILAELEVNKRVFMLGQPVRADLNWRERALRIINYDLIERDTDVVVELSTLSPMLCFSKLNDLLVDGVISPRGNIIICPHGSKMQTVGVWHFCDENPDVRVVLSHPKDFYPTKFSTGFRDTFVFDPLLTWRKRVSA